MPKIVHKGYFRLFFGFLEASVVLLQLTMFTFYKAEKYANQFVTNLGEVQIKTTPKEELKEISASMIQECNTAMSYYHAALIFRGLSFVTIYLTDAYVVVKYWNLHLSLRKFAGVKIHKRVEKSSQIIFFSLLVCTIALETAFVLVYWNPFED